MIRVTIFIAERTAEDFRIEMAAQCLEATQLEMDVADEIRIAVTEKLNNDHHAIKHQTLFERDIKPHQP